MKKAQKEHIKAGGEMARARYQDFLKRPEWLTSLSDEERKLAISILMDCISIETNALKMFTEQYGRLLEMGKDNHHQSREAASSCAHRIGVIHKLECLLRYGSTEELALYGNDN